ncbi:Disease resistance protein [Morus notabilis]|uniref:Disease resistance protein n=1 Tax=Morus notabilis TaxID=981085 RepID=W9RZV6_9ROSA|nr:disease resistance protein At4g27190 [Morus notabilis]EXC05118.1 Disease resistance protein [Morus notabilis]
MEVLTSILGGIVAETGKSLCGSIRSNIKNTVWWKLSFRDLEKEMRNLMDVMAEIKNQLESAEKDGRSPKNKVKEWLREVEDLVLKVESIQARIPGTEKKLCGCLLRCNGRFRYGRKVARARKNADNLIKAGKFPDGVVSVKCLEEQVEYIPGPTILEGQTTASRTLDELVKILDVEKFRRIGVWGMGGVGKTTLVKNLNNKLKSNICLKQPFSIVIWATVSKELDMRRVQIQIAERLNLEVKREESIERIARRLYQRLEREERFLLILDDVWEKIDFDCLGVPHPEHQKGSKIILTSRFLEVCRAMMTDTEVKVNILKDEETWQLFGRYAGEVASLEQIEPFAKAVARECCGLPLAIITVGAAMRGKAMIKLWKHALNELRRSVPCVGGIKNQVYNPLKWSYDSLEGNNTKACFLYCALYPEDFCIEVSELVKCWLAEGLIDDKHDFENSMNKAIAVIEILKDSCLLEDGDHEGTVKMHDVVRDVAIWIASSLEDEFKSLVRSGIGLSEISEVEILDSFTRVSFMTNKINKLPDCEGLFSKASTLLLQGNLPLERVPEQFLQGFHALRVLNLSGTRIRSLPVSLLHLHDLRALLLRDCFFLEELPPLGTLNKLQTLDLCATRISELPEEMEKLINLRQVNLSRTHYLKKIQAGIVSKWTCLELLDMTLSSYHWGTKGEVEEGQATFEELGCLKRLFSLSIRLKSIPCLGSEDLTWIGRLRRFQFFIGTTANSLPTRHDKRRVTISGLNLSGEWIQWWLSNASSLVLNGCWGLNEMFQDLAIYGAENYAEMSSVGSFMDPKSLTNADLKSLGSFMALKSLTITSSNSSLQPGGGCAAPYDLLPNLEELHLHGLTYLASISELVGHLGLLFSKLKLIEVVRCPRMKCLLSCGIFILSLPNLETIKVGFCEKLEELFNYTSNHTSGVDPVVPNLRTLELKNLPKLKILCRPRESWPSLEQIYVVKCNLLRKLPVDIRNANTIKEIRGEPQWWSGLKWDSLTAESALQPYFKDVGAKKI